MFSMDTIIAFIILTIMIYSITVIIQKTFTYEDDQLYNIIRDAGLILEKTGLENINKTLSLLPAPICLKINVKVYDETITEQSSSNYVKTGCHIITNKNFVNKRTMIDNDNYVLITIEGWFK